MDDLREAIILETDNIRLTDRRAFIGWRAYQIAGIRSVSLDEKNLVYNVVATSVGLPPGLNG